jgi:hypothetical protein
VVSDGLIASAKCDERQWAEPGAPGGQMSDWGLCAVMSDAHVASRASSQSRGRALTSGAFHLQP